jgi:class 3 adenylate cyclase
VAAIFVVTALMFLFYDRLVERRQQLILSKAVQSTAIVASIFPKNVRERLMQANENDKDDNDGASNHRLTSFLSGDSNDNEDNLEPIADLFPNCTVLFADISGFTAWSSTRDPAQVFVLLQTVYQAFDEIAKQRKVFKVETIGDSCKFGHESQG